MMYILYVFLQCTIQTRDGICICNLVLNYVGLPWGGGGHVSLGPVHHPRQIKNLFRHLARNARIALRVSKTGRKKKREKKGIKFTDPPDRSADDAERIGNLGAIPPGGGGT